MRSALAFYKGYNFAASPPRKQVKPMTAFSTAKILKTAKTAKWQWGVINIGSRQRIGITSLNNI
jgi:hypothetical protein